MYREAIVLYSTRLGTEELQPDIKTDRATDIDTLPLVIHEPQPVRFCDRIYSIEREGLYRFIDLGWCRKDKKSGRPQCLNPEKRYIRNLIHFREDVGSLFQALSRLHVGGSAHQSWSIDKLIQQAMRGRLSVSCGRISEFTCELLKMQNVRCRLVGIVTLEEWKTTGFGHTMFEYFDEKKKKWILGDISMRCLFMKGKAYLNLYQLTNAVRYRGDFRIKRIVGYPICNIDPSSGIRGEFDLSVLSEEIKATEASVKRWFQHTAYIPLIEENERWWFWAEDQKEKKRIENCASFYSYLPKEEWLRRFYPNFQEVNHAGG